MLRTDKVAVVILNWNGLDMLRRFLPSVVQGSAADGLVVVADNGSTDGSLAMLASEFPTVERLPLDRNYGFAEGYNRALAQIDAPYYLLLNSDVRVDDGWLRPLVYYMEAHPEVAACQPKLLSEREPQMFEYAGGAGGYLDRYGYPFCRGRVFGTVERDEGQYDEVCPVLWATGAALMVRQADWQASGGLDAAFFAHMEEIDLCWRLRMRGRKLVCVPQSRAYHVGGGTLDAGNPRKTYLNFRNNLLMLYKNLPRREGRRVLLVRRLYDALAFFQSLATLHFADAKAIVKAHNDFRAMRTRYSDFPGENLLRRTAEGRRNIIVSYYLRRRSTFDRLDG